MEKKNLVTWVQILCNVIGLREKSLHTKKKHEKNSSFRLTPLKLSTLKARTLFYSLPYPSP